MLTPIEQLIYEYEVDKGNPFFANRLKAIYEKERQEQAQARAKDTAEIIDLEKENTRLNGEVMKLELELARVKEMVSHNV